MNCSEAEQLFDAYLDGQLTGSLRLELDAHRLRCRRCQQTLAIMEACEHVLTADRRAPALAEDFTERVMSDVSRRRYIPGRLRSTRVALAAGFMLQAAAVLILAIIFQAKPAEPVIGPPEQPPVEVVRDDTSLGQGYRFAEMIPSAGRGVLAALGNPMREIKQVVVHCLDVSDAGGWRDLVTPAAEERQTPPPSPNHYSL